MRTIKDTKVLIYQGLRHRKLLRGQKNRKILFTFLEAVLLGFILYILFVMLFVISSEGVNIK